MIKIFKFSLSSFLLIKPYGFPLQSWVTIDFLIFNIISVFNIITVLSNEKSIKVEAGPVIRAISKLFSVFFLVFLVIELIVILEVILEDKSVLGRFFIITFFGFALLTSLVNFVHFLQYLLLRSTLNRRLNKQK